jgi:hypothetical protein
MKTISESARWTLGMCAVASLLAGCSGVSTTQTALPMQNGLPTTVEQNARHGVTPNGWGGGHKGSWMDPAAKHEDLIYVSDALSDSVTVYAWTGYKLLGRLAGINRPFGLCSDHSGNVWVIGWGKKEIFEYAHAGTKPLQVLTVNDPSANLYDCSIDPTTGNLAVTNWGGYWYKGNVFIFTQATGTPRTYTGPWLWYYYGCTYDDQGNLFADGWDAYLGDVFTMAELVKGGTSFNNIPLSPNVNPELVGGIRWDGKNLAIGNMGSVYTYNVRGHLTGLTFLTTHWPVGMFSITDLGGRRTIVAPDSAGNPNAVQKWNYPAGGQPMGTITRNLDWPFGVTVSKAQL